MNKPDTILFLDDHRGQYIPRDFAQAIKRDSVHPKWHGELDILAHGPPGGTDSDIGASEHYWDIWADICDNIVVTDHTTNVRYRIYQDGACWLVPEGMEFNERTETFEWPEETVEEE